MYLSSLVPLISLASLCAAQTDLASVLQSQPDLSTLLELVTLANLTETLASASNITIVAPTNDAFAFLATEDDPEGVAVRDRDAVSIQALLLNHVFQGYYPSSAIGEVPTFAQTLLQPDAQNDIQPFTAITGGQYNGFIRNGNEVNILSSEFTVSRVTEADILVGDNVIIHKIDKTLSFGAPLTLFLARYGYENLNAALVASNLSLFSGTEINSASESPITDVTVFVPLNAALEAIGSVLAGADQSTLQEVLKYHVVQDNIVFSPSITNTTVTTAQGGEVTLTVADGGSAFVNDAKVVLPNILLYEGVAHIIDSVLNPLVEFDRSQLEVNAPASERVQFEGASSTSVLPFTSITFAGEAVPTNTINPIFSTALAVSVAASTTGSGSTTSTGQPAQFTGAADSHKAGSGVFVAGAIGMAVMIVNELA